RGQPRAVRADLRGNGVAHPRDRPAAGRALTAFDRSARRARRAGPDMVIAPPSTSAIAGGATLGVGRVRAGDAGDPLLPNVDLQDVHVARSQDLRASTFGRVLLSSLQTPLVLVRDEPFRQALFGFDLHESDLPLRVAFPILMQNLSEWMLPPSVPSHSFQPDEPVTIVPDAGTQSLSVVRPDGSTRSLTAGGIATFADTDPVGLYTVVQSAGGKVTRSWFTVNLFAEDIS